MAFACRAEAENVLYFRRLRGEWLGLALCPLCGGTGDGSHKCGRCGGHGTVEHECCERGQLVERHCDRCDGTGYRYHDCPQCGRRGLVREQAPLPTADGTLMLPLLLDPA